LVSTPSLFNRATMKTDELTPKNTAKNQKNTPQLVKSG
jgi:hypothetical protein